MGSGQTLGSAQLSTWSCSLPVLTHRNGNLRQNERVAADFEAFEHSVFCPCRMERELRIDVDLSETMGRCEGKCGREAGLAKSQRKMKEPDAPKIVHQRVYRRRSTASSAD